MEIMVKWKPLVAGMQMQAFEHIGVVFLHEGNFPFLVA